MESAPRAVPLAPRDKATPIARWELLALPAVMLLAFGLRQALLGDRPLWFDEAYSLMVARKSLSQMWEFLRTNDSHPIGYYALLSLWIQWFGTGLAAMRSSSLLLGLGAVLLTWRMGRELFSGPVGMIAAAYVALNPFQVIGSNEIRMYPLLECLTLGATWVLYCAFRSPSDMRWWLGYGLLAIAMAYTSYYAFWVLFAHAVWVGISRPPRAVLKGLAMAGGLAALVYAPWVSHVIAFLQRSTLPWLPSVSPEYLSSVLISQTFGGYLFTTGTYQNFGIIDPRGVLLLLPFVLLLGLGAALLGGINRAARNLLALAWIVPIAALVLAGWLAGHLLASPRHLMFLEPFAAILIAGGVVHLRGAVARFGGVAIPALAFALTLAILVPAAEIEQTNPAYQYYRFDLLADFMQGHYRQGDLIMYFPAHIALPFHYYFRPPGLELLVGLNTQRTWMRSAYDETDRGVARLLAQRKIGRAWLVFSDPLPKGSVDDLMAALASEGYARAPVLDFHGVWLTLFTR